MTIRRYIAFNSGAPQGTILSPLLKVVEEKFCLFKYADDTVFFALLKSDTVEEEVRRARVIPP